LKKLGYNAGDKLRVDINKKPVILPYVRLLWMSRSAIRFCTSIRAGRVGIAVNQGNYSKKFNIEPPGTIFIPRKGAPLKEK